MNGTDGHHHGNVADLKASDAVLDRERFDIVQLGGLGGASSQYVGSTGVLGVVECSDLCTMVMITHGPDEQRNATDRWARHQPDCLTDIKW
jgi:hypothetical protein